MATIDYSVNNAAEDAIGSSVTNQAVVLSRRPTSTSRRGWLWGGLGTIGVLLASSIFNPFSNIQEAVIHIDLTDYAARTKHVLSTTPLIDGHNDLPYLIRSELKHQIYNEKFTFNTGLLSNTDRKKLRDGMVGGQFWSAYIHCPKDSSTKKDVPLEDPTVSSSG